jgi:hypothetical protein
MTHQNSKWLVAAAASIAVAALAGCNDDADTVPAAQAPAAPVLAFSAFAAQAFTNSANSTPVSLDGFTFNFDVNDQPTYFNGEISFGSYQ